MVGNSASGKSTLSELLAARWRLPLRHIDRIFWKAGWRICNREEFACVHKTWIAESEWLIEGIGPWSELRERLAAAEAIIFLNTPVEHCLERAAQRMKDDAMTPNRFMADGCRYPDVVEQQREIIARFELETRPRLASVLRQEFFDKPQIVLDGRRTPDELLADCEHQLTTDHRPKR